MRGKEIERVRERERCLGDDSLASSMAGDKVCFKIKRERQNDRERET